jgi:hypothetical protein
MRARGSLWQWLRALAANTFRSSRRDRELRADIESYLNLLTDENIRAACASSEASMR